MNDIWRKAVQTVSPSRGLLKHLYSISRIRSINRHGALPAPVASVSKKILHPLALFFRDS